MSNSGVSLKNIIDQSLLELKQDPSFAQIQMQSDLSCDFVFTCKDKDEIGTMIKDILFEAFCSAKFTEDKWVKVQGNYDTDTKGYNLKFCDSQAEVSGIMSNKLRDKFICLFTKPKENKMSKNKFYNYVKYNIHLDSNYGKPKFKNI